MINIRDISESLLEQDIPGTLKVLRTLSPQLESMGFDIEIRDTDHTFDSLRIYPVARRNSVSQEYKTVYSVLNDIIANTCCKCGKQKDVKQCPYDDKNDWGVCHVFCPECYQKSLPTISPIPKGILKDCTGKYVKDGDILMGITKDDRFNWGLVLNKPTKWGDNYEGPHPEWGKFMLIHGYTSFPSSLAWSKRFIIIDNCGTDYNPYDDYNKHSYKYEGWLDKNRENNFDFEKFQKILKDSVL